jgi:hypothetical protein
MLKYRYEPLPNVRLSSGRDFARYAHSFHSSLSRENSSTKDERWGVRYEPEFVGGRVTAKYKVSTNSNESVTRDNPPTTLVFISYLQDQCSDDEKGHGVHERLDCRSRADSDTGTNCHERINPPVLR